MTKHTPEPWFTRDGKLSDDDGAMIEIFPANGNEDGTDYIADVRDKHGPESMKANAERIVACVNACAGIEPVAVHDLLIACKLLLLRVDRYAGRREGNDVFLQSEREQARAAINKASGE